jgi:Putative addiction module component
MFPPMSLTLDQIVEETRQWPEDTVAELLDRITLAKHGGLTPARDAAWTEIASRRSAEIDSGKEKLVPGHEVSAQIRQIVGR